MRHRVYEMRDIQFFNLNLLDRVHYVMGLNYYYGKVMVSSLFKLVYWTIYNIGRLA